MSQPLSDRTVSLVKATVPALEAHGLDIVHEMYSRMFQNPEIRDLFNQSHHGDAGSQPRALTGAILAYAANIDNLGALAAAVVLLLLLVLSVGTGPPATALPGQLPTDTVQVSITSMTPLNPQPGKTLRLAGNVRNRSDEDVTAIQVRLLLSSGPLTTRSEIPQVTDGSSDWDGPPTLAVSEPIPFLPAHTLQGLRSCMPISFQKQNLKNY